MIQPPIITEYIFELLKHIKQAYKDHDLPLVQKWFWPKGNSHSICVTHDIDFLVRQNLKVLGKRVDKRFFDKILILRSIDRLLRTSLSESIGNNIAKILELEMKLKLKSTFFMLSNLEEYKEIAPEENLKEEHLKNLTKTLLKAHEVGLHGSSFSYKNPDLLKKEKAEIESYFGKIKGIRQHRLNFLPPLTWEYQQLTGLEYDSTFSHNEYFGFRSGLCHPYRPVNPINKQIIDILEIPLSFMDWTFMHRRMDLKNAFSVFKRLNLYCKRYSGVLVVNFHNIYFDQILFPKFSSIFSKMLKHISTIKAWKPTLSELSDWWAKRKQVKLNVTQDKKLNIQLKSDMPVESLCIMVNQKDSLFVDLDGEENIRI